jgi:hypothetical protein
MSVSLPGDESIGRLLAPETGTVGQNDTGRAKSVDNEPSTDGTTYYEIVIILRFDVTSPRV